MMRAYNLEMRTTIISYLTFLIGLMVFSSCDPGHIGNAYIDNQSATELKLVFNSNSPHYDTTIFIQPETRVDFLRFGGLGAGNKFDCCLCEFNSIILLPTDTSKHLTKPITDKNNWVMTNPNDNRFQNKRISCEFIVTQSDIQ